MEPMGVSNRPLDDENYVYVPVPRRLLAAFYRALAQTMAEATDDDLRAWPGGLGSGKRNLIDLIVQVAASIGAEQRPVEIRELHDAYLRAFPGIGKGTTPGSFAATINYHCINMRSRFPDNSDHRKPAYWLSRPVFKRVARARYMLLSPDEIAWFNARQEADDPVIYQEEYDVAAAMATDTAVPIQE